MDPANAVEDGTDAAAEFMIVAVVEAFEIHLIQINPRADVFQNLQGCRYRLKRSR